ncbi:anthranilate phosphoribosyltransferase [Leptospirillum ferriphilum]|uniref:Putative anthranilate phosphoribosyltransferase n=1 Tax=Leptospirillum ferriphilum (strain ML-04) TaxID=1048260 RepID=J9Z8E7_LEPFM|nr:anthranilate phosphoribosyltransferase [Leptospirillum ferriphilum]AFS52416.1 putative anthranilate phosphoribosyltransferase [Leptospirillum ferriphilum ML-04]
MKTLIKTVGTGPHGSKDLSVDQAREAAALMLDGRATPAQIGALLLAIRTKGEADTELEGFFQEARSRILSCSPAPPVLDALDIGDPYDGHIRTPGLAIPASLWAAHAGLKIVLHGYPDLPAKFGVGHTRVWEALGMSVTPWQKSLEVLNRQGIVVLSPCDFLPGWTALQDVRQELGLRTLLNTVEKSLNPLNARRMLTGYFHESLAPRLHALLRKVYPEQQVTLVSGSEGSVDLHAHRPTRFHPFFEDHSATPRTIAPPQYFPPLPELPARAETHADFVKSVLTDNTHPHYQLVRYQAAFFLWQGGHSADIPSALASLPDEYPSILPDGTPLTR